MEKFSLLNLAKHALTGHKNWEKQWRSPEPKKQYDVVIIGGGGHGLATAYYLAKKHGITNVAVIEKGWLGGGNTGRNTTIIRSNYFYPEAARFFHHSVKLYEDLSKDLNYNIMFSQCGAFSALHNHIEMDIGRRACNASALQGVDLELMGQEEVKEFCPLLDVNNKRFPIVGGVIQRRAGVARHDAVAWAYARAADALGVDILQGCEVTDININSNNTITGVETSKYGTINADKVAIAVAGNSSVVAEKAGLKLPIRSFALQATVSEPVKPILNGIISSGMLHTYVSQSDRGELVVGASHDPFPSYTQRGSFPEGEHSWGAVCQMFPSFSRMKVMRQWAGIIDGTPDSMFIIGKTPVKGLYLNGGWGYGGFKAIPAGGDTYSYTIANDKPHELVEPFSLDRFTTGRLINEAAAAGGTH